MTHRLSQLLLSLLLLASPASVALSAWDETQLRLLEQYSTPLRWDNLEGSPYWVSGPRPAFRLGYQVRYFRLNPGETAAFRAPARSWLRLEGDRVALRPEDLQIGISTDARLFADTAMIQVQEPSALVTPLPQSASCLVRLTRPAQAPSELVFAVFLSRNEPYATIAPGRNRLGLPGRAHHLQREDEVVSEPAWLVTPAAGIEIPVTGPAWVELVARMPWAAARSSGAQTLLVDVEIEGQRPQSLILVPGLDDRRPTRVNGAVELVSFKMRGFLGVPAGPRRVRIRPGAPVYLTVFTQSYPDYLFPGFNAPPRINARDALQMSLREVHDSPRGFLDGLGSPPSPHAYAAAEQEAWQAGCDNNFPQAGGQAADWIDRMAQARLDYPPAQDSASALWRQRTFYREVWPHSAAAPAAMQRAFFDTPRLSEFSSPERPLAVLSPTLTQVLEHLSEAQFTTLPPSNAEGLIYRFPGRSHDSRLRLAVAVPSGQPTDLLVQLDSRPAVRVRFDAEPALRPEAYEPSTALATLRALQYANRRPPERPTDEWDLPLPLREPGVIELSLPQQATQVRISQPTGAVPAAVSVAYRASSTFALGEAAYLDLLKQCGSNDCWQLLSRLPSAEPPGAKCAQALYNQWLPLIRRLRAHAADFANSIVVPSSPAGPAINPSDAVQLRGTAQRLETEGHLIDALEIWSQLFWRGDAEDQLASSTALARGLSSLGEDFLALQYARFALQKSPPGQAPAAVLTQLEARLKRAEDFDGLEQLRAVVMLKCPCPEHLASLVEALGLNSKDQMALWAGLALPAGQRPLETLLTASLHRNWWTTFDQLCQELSDADDRRFWQAQKHLAFCDFTAAKRSLGAAGNRGREMLSSLEQGLAIRERLAAAAPATRLAAVFEWEQWLAGRPGPIRWQSAPEMACEAPGAELLFNVEQDQFSSCFRSEPGRPVKLRFHGPLRMRVEIRPILPFPFARPVDDWFEMVEFGVTNRVALCQVTPNPSLRITGSTNLPVGLKSEVALDWGPGLHEVSLGLAANPGLVEVFQAQPALPTRVLPSLTPESLKLGLQRHPWLAIPPKFRAKRAGEAWWVPPEEARWPQPVATASASFSALAIGLTEAQNPRLALRLATGSEPVPSFSAGQLRELPPAEQWLAACRWQRWNDFQDWKELPERDRNAWLLATGQVAELLKAEPSDLLSRLTLLLQVAEFCPDWREHAQCAGEFLAIRTNCPPGCRSLLARLCQDRAWTPLPISPLSAGIRALEAPFDLPQDPSVRLRQALLPPADTNQFTLTGAGVMSISVNLQHPSEVTIDAQLAKAGLSPALGMSLAWQVDALESQRLMLTPEQPAGRTRFALTPGSHLVRVWIADPVVNQFARVRLSGRSLDQTNSLWLKPIADSAVEKRFFYGATSRQPVRFTWIGPALLRVDEWRDGRTSSQLRLVAEGPQELVLPPPPGRDEAWYKVFVRATRTNKVDVRPVWTAREPEPLPPPRLDLPEAIPPAEVHLADYYGLGGQEDGTWTAGLRFAKRRPFELTPELRASANEFVQLAGAYRKVNPAQTVWFQSDVLARRHTQGDLTLGVGEQIQGRPKEWPFEWLWSAAAFVGALQEPSSTQASIYTDFEIGQRRRINPRLEYLPYAGLFASYLTLDPEQAVQQSYVDQDLYTLFRYQHRWGWNAGTRLDYRPWLDTLLRANLALVSNENFTPDHWGLRLTWSQLLGPVQAHAGYQFWDYIEDSDRPENTMLHGFLIGVTGECWISGRHRLDIGGQFRYDWPNSGSSYFLVLSWDFSQGRGYRDYAPQDMRFRELRERRIPARFNNALAAGPPGAVLP